MYDEKVEQAIREQLHKHEAARQLDERKMAAARLAIDEDEQAIEHWQFALNDYRREHGLEAINHSPVLQDEYSSMGPTELVEYWANKHDGEVVIKELTHIGLNAGIFKKYRNGSSSIYSVLKRKQYDKLGPGYYKRPGTRISSNLAQREA